MKLIILITVFFVSACSSQEPAEVVYGTKINIPKSNSNKSTKSLLENVDKDSNNIEEKGHYLKIKEEPKQYIHEEYELDNKSRAQFSREDTKVAIDTENEDLDAEIAALPKKNTVEKDRRTDLNFKDQELHKKKIDRAKDQKAKGIMGSGSKLDGQETIDENDKQNLAANSAPNKNAHNDEYPKVKLIKPVNGAILSKYGAIVDGTKLKGIDFSASAGASVKASYSGIVVATGKDNKFGYRVILKHESLGIQTAYAHLGKISVSKGQVIRQGEEIGFASAQPNEKGEIKVHFAIRIGSEVVDPITYLEP
ncbi:MAG: M23 family metallopeptidase [Rickettsiaceae bacterium]|nr:M23 family metallopeptidase [Rickettsiaceae bacterium]